MKQQKLIRMLMLAAVFATTLGCVEILRAQGSMPKISFKDRRLANGMRVLSAPDHSSPTVAIHGPQRLRTSFRTHHVQSNEEHEVRNDGPPY